MSARWKLQEMLVGLYEELSHQVVSALCVEVQGSRAIRTFMGIWGQACGRIGQENNPVLFTSSSFQCRGQLWDDFGDLDTAGSTVGRRRGGTCSWGQASYKVSSDDDWIWPAVMAASVTGVLGRGWGRWKGDTSPQALSIQRPGEVSAPGVGFPALSILVHCQGRWPGSRLS